MATPSWDELSATNPTELSWDSLLAEPPKQERSTGIIGTIASGAKGAMRGVGAAADLYQGDNEELGAAARAQQAERKDPRLEAFMAEIAAWKKGQDDAGAKPDWIDTAKALGSAAWNNPAGAGLMIAEQLPNSVVSLGAGYGGMKAGGILGGAVAGPPGAAAGAVIGGLAGYFGANTALETGNKAIEARQAGPLSDEQRSEVMGEGARKGAVITGIDALTLGATNIIGKATTRAVEAATAKTLTNAGVNISDKAAVMAARQDQAIVSAVQAAQKTAADATTTLGQRAMRTGGQAALETFGEGAGEYLGEYAASGELDKMEALIEAFSSAGTSAAEIALTKTWGSKATDAAMWGDAPAPLDSPATPPADSGPTPETQLQGIINQATGVARPTVGVNPFLSEAEAAAQQRIKALEKNRVGPPKPEDILAAPDADSAIAAFTASLTGTDMTGIIGRANPLIAPAREMQAQAAADEADLADLAQTETRDLNTLRAQLDQESRKQAELDAIQATGTGQYGIQPEARSAVEQAATVEAPTAMQLAMQRAKAAVIPNEGQPLPMTAPKPAAPAQPAPAPEAGIPASRQPDILPADIARLDGKPFQTENGAKLKQREAGGVEKSDIVPVAGGFVVRPKPTQETNAQTDQAQPQPTQQQNGTAAVAPVIEASPAGQPAESGPVPAKAQDQRLIPVSQRGALTGDKIDREWTAFTPESGTKGIPRAEMPQIKAEHRGAMTQFLAARGITHENVEVPAGDLKPTQAEFSPGKVAKAKGYTDTDRSILISSDGHVLDGHHQWLAKMEAGEPIKAIRLGAPIEKLLAEVKEFPSAAAAAGATSITRNQVKQLIAEKGMDAAEKSIKALQDSIKKNDETANYRAKADPRLVPVSQRPDPEHVGRENVPLSEGGKPFKTNKAAKDAKKNQPMMRVVRVAGGFALAPKTDAQIAAQEKNAKRLAVPRFGNPVVPLAAHEFIAGRGGLRATEKSDMGIEGNPRVGNRFLFGAAGIDMDEATESLKEAGYLGENASHDDARNLINRSLRTPQYTSEGTEQMAEREMEDRRKAFEAEQEAIAAAQEAEDNEWDIHVAAFERAMLDMPEGLAQSDMDMEDALLAAGYTQQEIENERSQAERAEADQDVSETPPGNSPQGDRGREGAPGEDQAAGSQSEGLTAPTRADVLRQQAQAEAEAQRKADGGDKPAPAKPITGDVPDMFNTQGSVFDQPAEPEPAPAAERFEAGKALTKEQRREVLKTLVDVYKAKGAPREQKGVGPDGNERYGYVYSPELFEKSAITGAMVRYHVTLPDGRLAHPTELFPDYTQADIDTEMARRDQETKDQLAQDESRSMQLRRRVADTLGGANRLFNVANPGARDYVPATLTNGTEFARTTPENAERDAKLLGSEWKVLPAGDMGMDAPATQAATILDAANVTGSERLSILKDVKSGALTPDEVQGAFPGANPPVANESSAEYDVNEPDAPYETDLFGQPVPAPTIRPGPARPTSAGVRGNVQPASAVQDTPAPAGEYFASTLVGSEVSRELGASRITKPEHAAQATTYLYKSAVERLDGIVTDKNGKPLGIVGGFKGALSQASVYPATLVAEAVRIPGAAHIWFSHNHPSGNSQLSRADESLNQVLSDVFRGSGIEPMGLLAIGNGKFSFAGQRSADVIVGDTIPDATSTINVPVIERSLAPGGTMGPSITSPAAAKQYARDFYAKAQKPGLMLMDAQNTVIAWVPITDVMTGELRGTGGLNSIYRAISQANAGSAIIVHGGELGYQSIPKKFPQVTPSENIAAALKKVDVRPLDSVDVTRPRSVAEDVGYVDKGPVFARNNQAGRGVHIDDANAVVAAVREALPTAPTIHIMESVSQAPAELRKFIRAAGAENYVDAAYHQGEIYVFPANIPSIERMQFVLAHHEIRHHGLAAMLGPRKNAVMLKIHESNPKIRALASEQVRKGYAKSRILATEEALADMPVADLVQLNGFDRIVAAVREWLRGAAARLRRAGLSNVADAIDAKEWTDKDVAALIARAEGVSRGGSARYASEGTVFADDGALARTGDQTSTADTLFARSAVTGQPLAQTWQGPDESRMDAFLYSMQDKHIDTKRVVTAVRDAIGGIADNLDPYLQEELYHGRAAKSTKDFLQQSIRPLMVDMQARGVEMSDFEEYLHNRHAERRNVQVAKVNPNMQDGGSGIKTADARAYLTGLPAAKRAAYQALAKRVDQMNRETRALLVSSGLEKQSTIDAWDAAYGDEYVPLMREEMDNGAMGIGQGFSVRGSSSKRAMGSDKPVANILANIALQREKAITRAEKRKIGEALYGMVLSAPNPDFWFAVDPALQQSPAQITATSMQLISMGMNPVDAEQIAAEPTQRYIDPRTGQVASRINPALRSAENVLAVRMDGEDKYVFFNAKDPRAMRMAKALKNLDSDQLGMVMGNVAKVTRYFAAISTQYNPVFGIVNLTRDIQTALLNLQSTALKGKQAEVMKHVGSALRGIYIDLRDHRAGKAPTSTWANIFEEFQNEGGATGFRDMYANAQERADAIVDDLKKIKQGKAMAIGRGLFGLLSDYNESMENAVRVAAYKVAKEQGMTKQQAASLAKNLTVNFNRGGVVKLQAGALYSFFNAAVQGSARMAQTMFEPGKVGKLSGFGKKIMAGGMLLGSMQALLLAAAGYDDEEPPDFVRERSIVLPIGGDKYISIPMPLGFHVVPGLARIPTEWAMGGFKDTPKRIGQLVGLFADAFNPIGSAGLSLQTLAPTIIDPLAALAENRDWTGKPIAKKDFNSMQPTAGHLRAKDTATPWARAISYGVNWVTGGTDYKPGLASPTPDQIDYLIGQATGGVGREVSKLSQVAGSTVSGEELPLYKIPLLGRFVGTTAGQAAESGRFYSNLKEIGEHDAELTGLKKDRRMAEYQVYVRENPQARLVPIAERTYREVSKLNRAKRDALKAGASKERIKLIDQQITARMAAFNLRVKATETRETATQE